MTSPNVSIFTLTKQLSLVFLLSFTVNANDKLIKEYEFRQKYNVENQQSSAKGLMIKRFKEKTPPVSVNLEQRMVDNNTKQEMTYDRLARSWIASYHYIKKKGADKCKVTIVFEGKYVEFDDVKDLEPFGSLIAMVLPHEEKSRDKYVIVHAYNLKKIESLD